MARDANSNSSLLPGSDAPTVLGWLWLAYLPRAQSGCQMFARQKILTSATKLTLLKPSAIAKEVLRWRAHKKSRLSEIECPSLICLVSACLHANYHTISKFSWFGDIGQQPPWSINFYSCVWFLENHNPKIASEQTHSKSYTQKQVGHIVYGNKSKWKLKLSMQCQSGVMTHCKTFRLNDGLAAFPTRPPKVANFAWYIAWNFAECRPSVLVSSFELPFVVKT